MGKDKVIRNIILDWIHSLWLALSAKRPMRTIRRQFKNEAFGQESMSDLESREAYIKIPILCPRCNKLVEEERDMLILISDSYCEVMCGECYYTVNNEKIAVKPVAISSDG